MQAHLLWFFAALSRSAECSCAPLADPPEQLFSAFCTTMPSYYSLALLFALSLAIGDALFGITFLQPDEQVLLKGLSTLTVRNGPGL